MTQSRRGRPPKVVVNDTDYAVTVKKQTYQFRKGSDGRIRALGTPERSEDFEYAKAQVVRVAGEA